jgi:hypothetical protein
MIPNPRNATRIETFSFVQDNAPATVRIRYDKLDAGQAKWGNLALAKSRFLPAVGLRRKVGMTRMSESIRM